MQYNPTPDRSGEILAQGNSNAALMQMASMQQLGGDIGGALAMVGKSYADKEAVKARGRGFKKVMEVVGPTIGMDTAKLAGLFGGEVPKGDFEMGQFAETMMPVLPSLINAQLGQQRMSLSQDQMDLRRQMPSIQASVSAQKSAASGQGRMPGFSNINFGLVE
jgi:hypothetical protein